MKTRKIFAILLAVCIATSALSGCSQWPEEDENSSSSSSSSSPSNSSSTPETDNPGTDDDEGGTNSSNDSAEDNVPESTPTTDTTPSDPTDPTTWKVVNHILIVPNGTPSKMVNEDLFSTVGKEFTGIDLSQSGITSIDELAFYHCNDLYTNWLNYYVYQTTPYDIREISDREAVFE